MSCHALRLETGYDPLSPYYGQPKPAPYPVAAPVAAPGVPGEPDDTAEIMGSVASYLSDALTGIRFALGIPQKEERTAQYIAESEQAKLEAAALDQATPPPVGGPVGSALTSRALGIPIWAWAGGGIALFLLLRKG